MQENSHLDYNQAAFIEGLYGDYQNDKSSVDAQWKLFFEGMEFALAKWGEEGLPTSGVSENAGNFASIKKQIAIMKLITAYRARGHLIATINPLRPRRDHKALLNLEHFGLSDADLSTVFDVAGQEVGLSAGSTLQDIINKLKDTYCGNLGVEYMHMRRPDIMLWLRKLMEPTKNRPAISGELKQKILHNLNLAEVFEKFIHTKYVGQKRFSLEGGDVLIPALDYMVERGSELGCRHFLIGMAHRGRLNVLCNILGKTYEEVFSEFEDFEKGGVYGSGDVKYHKGFSTIRNVNGADVKLTLAFNPSHLEAVDTVVQGMTRAKAEQWFEGDYEKLIPILIHGDAAISGQGIVYEALQMSNLNGYTVGGTVHIVINNQVGFTTNPRDSRSTLYCTDISKATFAPVFHVNGYDPEAVIQAMELAIQFRQKYRRDVFIDILCTRKHGHNESDEPRFTQPIMYSVIDKMKTVREQYTAQLLENGSIDAATAKQLEQDFKELLQDRLDQVKERKVSFEISVFKSAWANFRSSQAEDFDQSVETGVDRMKLEQVGRALARLPEHIKPIKQIPKLLQEREQQMANGVIGWGMGELLAFGTLLQDGHPVRVSGQDVQRGTFTHRQSVIKDAETEEEYLNLNHINENQAKIQLVNSHLSEYGVLGFEYGFAMSTPNRLTIWEAQFGDFCNGAQIIIDQFLCSAESKWGLSNGLVMLLPHGYEGQGPEHSSARLERFLQLCAEDNMQVLNCTTPANYFHALRRQLASDYRKPLIVMTPKSLLRHPVCVSPLADFEPGTRFKEVIDDSKQDPSQVERVILCSGKLYYELLTKRAELEKDSSVAIIRLEQLYPFPKKQLRELVDKYDQVKLWHWCQEEPLNQGGWDFIKRNFKMKRLKCISRPSGAAPAEGSIGKHKKNQALLLENCFTK